MPAGRPSSESTAVSVDQILDEVVPSAAGARSAATSAVAPAANRSPAAPRRASSTRIAGKPLVIRRRYAEYAEEYQYVWADLRKILMVAGLLVVLLIAASFFIE
jgi:hypothetical protein